MPPVTQLGAEGSSLLKSDLRSRWEIFFKARGLPASPCPRKLEHLCEQLRALTDQAAPQGAAGQGSAVLCPGFVPRVCALSLSLQE